MIRNLVIAATCSLALFACGGGNKADRSDSEVAEQSLETSDEDTAQTAPMEHGHGHGHGMKDGKGMHGKMGATCPMHVEGTTMAIEEVEGGMALVFTNPANVEEIQKRVSKMAAHHGEMMAQHQDPALPPATAAAENTDSGARLVLSPQDPTQVDAFRAEFQRRHDAQGEKKCPMMVMHGGEPMSGAESAPN